MAYREIARKLKCQQDDNDDDDDEVYRRPSSCPCRVQYVIVPMRGAVVLTDTVWHEIEDGSDRLKLAATGQCAVDVVVYVYASRLWHFLMVKGRRSHKYGH